MSETEPSPEPSPEPNETAGAARPALDATVTEVTVPHDEADAPATRRATRTRDRLILVGGLVLLVAATVFLVIVMTRGDGGGEVGTAIHDADGGITYVIPNGVWARNAKGEKVAVIPSSITVKVGQRLSIRNEDTGAHIAGPFYIGPGETSTYRFEKVQVIEGECTLHPDGKFRIDVVA